MATLIQLGTRPNGERLWLKCLFMHPNDCLGQWMNDYLLPVSRNHQGRRGTTVDIGDNLLSSLTVLGCSLTAVEVETGPLSDAVFSSFLLPSSFPFPGYCAL